MRVLHVTHNFPRWRGDHSGNFLHSLAREQVALGHEVAVVAPHADGLAERETIDGVLVERFRYGPDSRETLAYTGIMHEQVRRSWRARWSLLVFLRALRRTTARVARESRAEVVHLHWWFPAGMVLWPTRTAPGLPTLLTSHGTDLFMLRGLPALRTPARWVLARAAAITTVSHALADEVRALGVSADRVSVLPMPLDLDAFGGAAVASEGRDSDHVLFVGRLSLQKGVQDLLDAVRLAATQRPTIRLTVIGDGAERTVLEARARSLGIEARVDFRGALPTSEVARAYRRATVLAIPSSAGAGGEREGFGLVAVEAMLAGLPVIATSTGGLVDIVQDGITGWLVPERDAETLSRAILTVLADPGSGRARSERARADVLARFAPRSIARQYTTLYERIVGGAVR